MFVGISMVFYTLAIGLLITPSIANAQTVGAPATIGYNGRLFNASGTALSGTYYFWFDVESAITAGTNLASNVQGFADADGDGVVDSGETAITVTNGFFTVEIPIGADVADFANNVWLEMKVHTADSVGSAETLAPRVRVTKTPYSIFTQAIENSSADPTVAFGGRMYYDTDTNDLKWYNGTSWLGLASNLDTAYNNFGATAAKITVDAAQSQTGGFEIESSVTTNVIIDLQSTGDFVVQDAGSTWAQFTDAQAFDIDGTGAISLDADAASNFSTSVGALTLSTSAGGTASSVIIQSLDTSSDAIYLDADGATASGIYLDAYDVTTNTAGTIIMDAGSYMQINTYGAAGPGSAGLDVNVGSTGTVAISTVDGAISINAGGSGAATLSAASGDVSLDTTTSSRTITIGDSDFARTINIGEGTGADTMNFGTGADLFNFVSTETTNDITDITFDSLTTANGIDYTVDGLTTGRAFYLTHTGTMSGALWSTETTGAWTGEIWNYDDTGNAAWTGNVIDIDSGTGAATGDFINLNIEAGATGAQALVVANAAASTVDLISISSTGAITTTGVDGLSLAFTTGDGTNPTNALMRGTLTSGGTAAGDIAVGLLLDLASTAGGTDTAIDIENTAGWDFDLDLQNDLTITNVTNNQLTFTENALSLTFDYGQDASTIRLETVSDLDLESTADGADALTLTSTAGGIDISATGASAGEDIDITATGSSINLTSTESAANSIYLHANGGINENIKLEASQGVDATTIAILANTGGITLQAGLPSSDAINLTTTNIGGGIDVDSGTGGFIVDSTGVFSLDGVGASNVTTASGNLTLATTTTGSLILNGVALVDVNAGANLDIDVTGTYDMLASSTFSIDGTGASNVTTTSGNLTLSTLTSGDLVGNSVAGIDLDAGTTFDVLAAGTFSIDGTGASNVTTTSGNLSLSTLTSGSLVLDGVALVDLNAGANLDIDVTGTYDMLASSTFSIDGTGASNVTTTSGNLTLSTLTSGDLVGSSVAGIDLDAGTTFDVLAAGVFSIDGTGGASNVSLVSDSAGDDLTIGLTGATDSSVFINSSGTGADAIALTASAGGIDISATGASAGEDIDITATGSSINLTSTENAANSIFLLANGGTSEILRIQSQQGTDSAAIDIKSIIGGVTLSGGLASADAINLVTTNTAGGIDIDAGTGGIDIDTTGAAGNITINTTSSGVNTSGGITLSTDTTNAGGLGGAIAIRALSTTGTGGGTMALSTADGLMTINSGQALDIDSSGTLSINATNVINIGNDNDPQNINIGTSGGRTLSIGNNTAVTNVTGDFNVTLPNNHGASIATAVTAGTVNALTITAQPNNDSSTGALVLALTPEADGSNAVNVTNTALSLSNITGTNEAGDRVIGIAIGNLTNGAGANDTALSFGNNWDFDIDASGSLEIAIAGGMEILVTGSNFQPASNDGNALGSGTNKWADLFLADGGVMNFNNGNYTLTHSAGQLATNEDFDVGDDFSVEGILDIGSQDVLPDNATPDVTAGSFYTLPDLTGNVLTDLNNGVTGQIVVIETTGADTLDCTGAGFACGGADVTLGAGDLLTFIYDGTDWILLNWMDQSGTQSGVDLAEWFPAVEQVESGDLLVASGTPIHVESSTSAYQRGLMGVVTTQPGLILGSEGESTFSALVALAGRVPVKVSSENGVIQIGDYLTSSATLPGYAMKATAVGPVIGMAMENFSEETGQIIVKVDNMWYSPISESSDLQGGNNTVVQIVSAESITASNAVFSGSVTVEEHLYGSHDVAGRIRMASEETQVRVTFETPYAYQPIVTFSSRSNSSDAREAWISNEDETGFTLNRPESSSGAQVEFNWIAIGVEDAQVTVSDLNDGWVSISVTDTHGPSAPAPVIPVLVIDEGVVEEAVVEEVITEEVPVTEEAVVEEVITEEIVLVETTL